MSKARASGREHDPITGLLKEGDRTVAMIRNGEVFAMCDGEKVGYIRQGFLYSMAGERLASIRAWIDRPDPLGASAKAA